MGHSHLQHPTLYASNMRERMPARCENRSSGVWSSDGRIFSPEGEGRSDRSVPSTAAVVARRRAVGRNFRDRVDRRVDLVRCRRVSRTDADRPALGSP